jgi:predicted RNase H-like HicB family nuclease
MKQVKIVIEKSKDHYSSYAENVEGVYGGGETPEEAKQSVIDAIKLLKKYNKPGNIPAILKGDYDLVYRFDTVSLLNYYKKVFTNAALERMTGINQKQIQHYSSGLKKPRAAQTKRIELAFHQLGSELMAVEL